MGVLREEKEELLHPRLKGMQPTDLPTAFTADIELLALFHAGDRDLNERSVRTTRSRHGHALGSLI